MGLVVQADLEFQVPCLYTPGAGITGCATVGLGLQGCATVPGLCDAGCDPMTLDAGHVLDQVATAQLQSCVSAVMGFPSPLPLLYSGSLFTNLVYTCC